MNDLFLNLTSLPYTVQGGRRFWEVQVAVRLLLLMASAVWVVAPVALWQSLGFGWMLLWLLPTSVAVFAWGLLRGSGGG